MIQMIHLEAERILPLCLLLSLSGVWSSACAHCRLSASSIIIHLCSILLNMFLMGKKIPVSFAASKANLQANLAKFLCNIDSEWYRQCKVVLPLIISMRRKHSWSVASNFTRHFFFFYFFPLQSYSLGSYIIENWDTDLNHFLCLVRYFFSWLPIENEWVRIIVWWICAQSTRTVT